MLKKDFDILNTGVAKRLLFEGISLLPKPSSYLYFAGEDFEAISSFIIGLGKIKYKIHTFRKKIYSKQAVFRFVRAAWLSARCLRGVQ